MRFSKAQVKQEKKKAISSMQKWGWLKIAIAFAGGSLIGYHFDTISQVLIKIYESRN